MYTNLKDILNLAGNLLKVSESMQRYVFSADFQWIGYDRQGFFHTTFLKTNQIPQM